MQHMKFSWRVGPAPSKRKEYEDKRSPVILKNTWEVDISSIETQGTAQANTASITANDCVAETLRRQPVKDTFKHAYAPAGHVLIPRRKKTQEHQRHDRERDILSRRPSVLLGNGLVLRSTSDPFSTTPVMLTGRDHDIIRTFRALFFHASWPNNPGTDYLPILKGWEQQTSTALTSKSCTNALLFTSAIWTRSKYSDQECRSALQVKSMKHQVASLESLRVELDYERPNLSSIIAIVLLAVGLAISGDNAAASVHFRGLRPLIEAYGGFLSLPYPVRAMMLSSDHATAVADMRPMALSADQWDPGPIFEDLSALEKQKYRGTLHSLLPLSNDIPPETLKFFAFHRDLLAVHEVALQKTEDRTRRTELLHWTLVRKFVELPATQDMRCVLVKAESKDSPLSQEAAFLALETSIRIAAQYLTRLVFYPRPGEASIFADFNDLQYWLDKPEVRSFASNSLLLWLLAAGACLERNLRLVRYRRRWHAPRFLLLARHMGLETTEAVSKLLQKFLYSKVPLQNHIEHLFAEKDEIFQDTNCNLGLFPDESGRSGDIEYIFKIPDQDQVDDHVTVVQWATPKEPTSASS